MFFLEKTHISGGDIVQPPKDKRLKSDLLQHYFNPNDETEHQNNFEEMNSQEEGMKRLKHRSDATESMLQKHLEQYRV